MLKPDDRDMLFGDRFGQVGWNPGDSGVWTPEGALDDDRIDALMDAYFDGDISDDDRVRLFELLRRDSDRCLRFVEMQRAVILLERAPGCPDQTEAILARLDAAGAPRAAAEGAGGAGGARRARLRIGPAASRLAVAAAVALAGVGLVILGQAGPPRTQRAVMHSASGRTVAPAEPRAPAAMTETPATSRPALGPGRLTSTRPGLFSDPGQPELAISGLGSSASGPAPTLDAASLSPEAARAAEMRRLMGFAYGGQPWRLLDAWPLPGAALEEASPATPAVRPARPARPASEKPHAHE